MLGGLAIFLATVIIALLFVPHTPELWVILGGSSFMFLVGLVDDIFHIKPYQKLIGQFISAAMVIGYGLVLPWTDSQIINIAITAFWLIGITNAINLLDNMDGLAAGIAAVAAFALAVGAGGDFYSVEFCFCWQLLSVRWSDFWFSISIRLRFLWAIAGRCLSVFCWPVR